jgi:hypothetical protein
MKRSLVVLFLTILLLCGVFLRAASNSVHTNRMQHREREVMGTEVKKDMQFLPNVVLM